jgi:replicative DNA helicase
MSQLATNPPRTAGERRAPRDQQSLARLFEKLPPHALEAEMCLLGSMLIDPQVIGDVIQIIRQGDDFYKPAHAAIFDALVSLYDHRSSVDAIQLTQHLVDRGVYDEIGGERYIIALVESVPSASSARHYARMVREKAVVRHLIAAAGEILHEAYHSPDDARLILDQAEQRIFKIAQQSELTEAQTLHALIDQTVAMIEANAGKPITGVPTGFLELDEITGGFQRGEMIIIAARPSMGKTALALNIAEEMAMRGQAVGFFSLEMGRQQVVQRLLAARSGLDLQQMRRGLNSGQYQKLFAACGELRDAPMFIDDSPGLSLVQLRAKARRMAANHQIKAVFIDYLQLLSAGGRVESRQMEVSEISRGLKGMARELNVPVICLSQLNRSPEQREGHRPRMSDLRESGSIEQDADVVAMLHREEYYHQAEPEWIEDNPDKKGVAELILTKQRNGPTGVVRMTWVESSTRFRDYTPLREPTYVSQARGPAAPRPAAAMEPKSGSFSPARAPAAPPPPSYAPADDDDDALDEPPI